LRLTNLDLDSIASAIQVVLLLFESAFRSHYAKGSARFDSPIPQKLCG